MELLEPLTLAPERRRVQQEIAGAEVARRVGGCPQVVVEPAVAAQAERRSDDRAFVCGIEADEPIPRAVSRSQYSAGKK